MGHEQHTIANMPYARATLFSGLFIIRHPADRASRLRRNGAPEKSCTSTEQCLGLSSLLLEYWSADRGNYDIPTFALTVQRSASELPVQKAGFPLGTGYPADNGEFILPYHLCSETV